VTGSGVTLPDTMHALRLHRAADRSGPADLRVDEVPVPEPAPDQVLVEVAACGVCASDLHLTDGTIAPGQLPQVLGHEAAGTVAAVGAEVTDWVVGDRVALLMLRHCGICPPCLIGRDNLCHQLSIPGIETDGAMAGYTLARSDHLVPIPSGVAFHEAAITTDAVATPYHAIKRVGVGEGTTVAIVGLGGLGMHAILLAKLAGAAVIGIDVDPVNLERATEWGADAVVDASGGSPAREVHRLTGGGTDRALEFVGSAATADQAVRCLAPGGRAAVVGVTREALATVPIARFVSQENEVVGSFGATAQDVGELFDLLDDGRLDLSRSVTHTTRLDGVVDALARLVDRDGHPVRTVVTALR
jgi:D-arabinose 1-dehydrogenase-like Zn-dependent alcohol dehydrogenase